MTMDLITFFQTDLDKVVSEINSFKNEKDLWRVENGVTNSAGNLTLHLLGNLNHFIGRTLGNSDYIRDRDSEFNARNVSREKLVSDLESLKEEISKTLPKLTEEDLQKSFPLKIQDKVFSTRNMLIFLLAHLNYHLGQINYLRRIMEGATT